ncbi:hypothetical protein TNCV_803101 [Trichonephila clavipes]|nr:hypothetical protein TNCV_803101 [Trichonephila clavipes]
MDELNLDQAPQEINKEEFQLECVRLQVFVAATDPDCKKELILALTVLSSLFVSEGFKLTEMKRVSKISPIETPAERRKSACRRNHHFPPRPAEVMA